MTDSSVTHPYFLLDTMGGFGASIEEQRRAPGRGLVTLAQFDDTRDEVCADRDLADVPPLELTPRGSPLLDAFGRRTTGRPARGRATRQTPSRRARRWASRPAGR